MDHLYYFCFVMLSRLFIAALWSPEGKGLTFWLLFLMFIVVSQIYPSELQLNKANTSDTEAAFLDLHLSISNGIVSTKIYDRRGDFNFEIINFPFLDGDFPRSTSYAMESISPNSFVLQEHLAMLLTSTLAINC